MREQQLHALVLFDTYKSTTITLTTSRPIICSSSTVFTSSTVANPAHLPNFLISSILNGGYTSAAHAKPT